MTSILIIDDSPLVVAVLREALQVRAFEVHSASDGEEGLSKLERIQPEVVLCDLNMPGMSGLDVVKAIHARDPRLPVLIFTEYSELALATRAMRAGAFGYLLKGCPDEVILEEIDAALNHRRLLLRNEELEREVVKQREARVLAEKKASLGTLVAGIAHEINNPLAVVISNLSWLEKVLGAPLLALSAALDTAGDTPDSKDGASTLLQDPELRSALREMAEVIGSSQQSAQRIARIVGDLRRLVAPSGEVGSCRLTELLQSMSDKTYEGVEMTWDVDPKVSVAAMTQSDVKLVIDNVVANAVAAVSPNEGKVRISVANSAFGIRIAVTDNGCGISKENLMRVGQPFFTTRAPTGTGLGLAVVQQTLRVGKGEFEIKSREGVGTTVTMVLPRVRAEGKLFSAPNALPPPKLAPLKDGFVISAG